MTEDQEAELHQILVTMDEYVERSDLENPHLGPDADGLDGLTAAQFVKQKFGTELAQLLVTSAIRSVIRVEPDKPSALFFVDYLKSATDPRNIIYDTAGGGQYLTNRQGRSSQGQCDFKLVSEIAI